MTYLAWSVRNPKFCGELLAETDFDGRRAVIPQITGTAYITGVHAFILSPHDPLQNGFSLTAMEEAQGRETIN